MFSSIRFRNYFLTLVSCMISTEEKRDMVRNDIPLRRYVLNFFSFRFWEEISDAGESSGAIPFDLHHFLIFIGNTHNWSHPDSGVTPYHYCHYQLNYTSKLSNLSSPPVHYLVSGFPPTLFVVSFFFTPLQQLSIITADYKARSIFKINYLFFHSMAGNNRHVTAAVRNVTTTTRTNRLNLDDIATIE